MKKVLSIWSWAMVLALCVGFSSCSNDDDEGGSNKDFSKLIVGKWKYYSYYNSDWFEVEQDVYVQFNADGSFTPGGKFNGNFTTWEVTGRGSTSYGEYGDSYKVVLKGDPMNDDRTFDICIIGKSIKPEIEGYDYPNVMAENQRGSTRWVRVK